MDEQRWPFETPRDEMFSRVVTRGRRIQMINRALIGAAVAGATAVGVAGFVVGFSGGGDNDASVAPAGVGYHACPESGVVGELGSGDRVFLTGTDESGGWVQLRSPQSESARVWIPAEAVDPDRAVDLPVSGCSAAEFEMAMPGVTTTTEPEEIDGDEGEDVEGEDVEVGEEPGVGTTTTTAAPGTPTTQGPTPTTQGPGTTAPHTTQAPTTTATTQPPQPGPTMTSTSVSPTPMVRRDESLPGWCEANWTPGGSEISTVRAHGVSNATSVNWVARINGQQVAQGSMAQSFQVPGQWQGQIGPFLQAGHDGADTVAITTTATGPGGSIQRPTSFTLNDCFFG